MKLAIVCSLSVLLSVPSPGAGTSHQDTCPHACLCESRIEPMQTTATPPACVDLDSLVAMFDPGYTNQRDGCCEEEPQGCDFRSCSWKVIITVKSKPGETCNFKIKVPVGLEMNSVCNGATQCAHSSSAPHVVNCGHQENYKVIANGVTLWNIAVKCAHCELE
jgi:hypothetical protein